MIDDLDRKIVRVLNQNARKSFRDVAKEVETSVTAVINRVKKLEESGFIQGYIPLVEPVIFWFESYRYYCPAHLQGKSC